MAEKLPSVGDKITVNGVECVVTHVSEDGFTAEGKETLKARLQRLGGLLQEARAVAVGDCIGISLKELENNMEAGE